MIEAPKDVILPIEELFDKYAKKLLISEQGMEHFHKSLVEYYKTNDPIFLIRQIKQQERGLVFSNDLGHLIKPTDNSPAWWLHYQLFQDKTEAFHDFNALIESIPCHIFKIKEKENVSKSGWHVAHIFNAKDRKTNINEWDRDELLKRTFRNIHPCNYFYLPKTNWQKNGGDGNVIAYFYDKFKQKYNSVFEEFESIVNPDRQRFEVSKSDTPIDTYKQESLAEAKNKKYSFEPKSVFNEKKAKRLIFKASEIEPLSDDEYFTLNTVAGIIRMTKKDFYKTFENVIRSKSYTTNHCLYSYSTFPKKAFQFLIK